MCSTSAADAELGWYRNFRLIRPKNNGMDQSFYFQKGGNHMLDVKMMRQNIEEVQEKLMTRGVKKKH